ncbi:Ubiquitin domain-containing protein 2 [Paramecium bursaria]
MIVNKYSHFQTLIPEQFVGVGIRRTYSYTTKLLKEELYEKRIEYWGIYYKSFQYQKQKLNLNHHVGILSDKLLKNKMKVKFLLQFFSAQSLIILANADLKLINNSLQQIYNSQGKQFDVPIFMINEPQYFPTVKFCDTNIIQNFNEDEFEVILRSSRLLNDISIQIQSKDSVVVLKQKVKEIVKVEKCRLFVNGKELQDHHQIGNYSISYGTIIQAFM